MCGKVFLFKTSLQAHFQRFHSQNESLKCNICLEYFQTKTKLNKHTRRHHPNKPFEPSQQCYLCPAKYTSILSIRRHYRGVHAADEYRTVCLSCNTHFATQEQFVQHKTPDENVLKCKSCGLSLPCENIYQKHVESHGNPTFTCDVS